MTDGGYLNCRYPHLILFCQGIYRIYSCRICNKSHKTTYLDTKTWKRFHDIHFHDKKPLTLSWDDMVWGKE